MDDIKKFIFKNKDVEEQQFLDYLKTIGMNLQSRLEFDQFVDIIRNQKLFDFNKDKKNEEEDEKNKEDINVNINNKENKEDIGNNETKEEENNKNE